MSQTTLLLNASYEPLSVIPWQRAMTMWCLEKVEVIAEYEDSEIKSTSKTFKMPSVVRLFRYVHRRYLELRFSRQNIYARDHYTCQYCGKKPPQIELSLDHVIPKVLGGKTLWDNIVACCLQCNHKKGGRTPEQANMKLLSKPYKPSYSQFTISNNKRKAPPKWLKYFI